MAEESEAVHLLNLEIVTPERKVYSGDVESFSAPGTGGGFQILFEHAPFLTTVSIGQVKIKDRSGTELNYCTTGGFVEVSNNRVTFLADTAERRDEIDIERARSAKSRAEERLSKKEAGVDLERARLSLERAVNRLKTAEGQ